MSASYLAYSPAPPLGLFVETLWTSARTRGLAHAREWGLPSGRADIVVALDRDALRRFDGVGDRHGRAYAGGILQGPRDGPDLRDTSGPSIVVGAHLRATGLSGFLTVPADALGGQTLALESVWPGFASHLRERILRARALDQASLRLRLFEALLARRLLADRAPDSMVEWAVGRLARGARIGALQAACDMAPATFIARFRRASGIAPKRLATLMRLQAALDRAHASMRPAADDARMGAGPASGGPTAGVHRARVPDWAAIAHDCGFSDQSHLSREFTRFAGMTPTHYAASPTAFASHAACR